MIYFTSDLHLGHKAVVSMQNRPFENVDEMNETLILNWNKIVHPEDKVFILGDLTHRCKLEDANALISRLKGHKVLIKGNHDKKYNPELFEGIYDFLELKGYCSTSISLMHYPMVEWPKSRHGSLHLHGHQHNTFEYNLNMKEQGIYRFDVGVDANSYTPVSLDFILNFFHIEK